MNTIKMMDLYTIGKQLGAGSFGVTYLCTQIATGKHYACKCIPKRNLVSQNECEMVKREVDILRLINLKEHPNIVALKDVLEDDDDVYIVMELCEGGTILDCIIQNGAFDEPRAAQMTKEIASAIEACHGFGIVHRDLKLENLLFQTKDQGSALKVIDFGLAQFFECGDVLTNVVGTPEYMAPEVMERTHGPKVDIWSLEVVLYGLLAGFHPFNGRTFIDVYKKIMKGHHLFAKDPWPCISKGAKDLIQRMLTYNANERLSASEVLKHPWILEISSRLEKSRCNYTHYEWIKVQFCEYCY